MAARFYHLQINVSDLQFYRELFAVIGWRIVEDSSQLVAATDGQVTVWVKWVERNYKHHPFHRKAIGLNHLAFRVDGREAVSQFAEQFLHPRHVKTLYASPREFSEYRPGYFAVYFEDPDRLKVEVVAVEGG